ncbi:unnamed protein product [Eruca vesicaria subsp. sativa]|uniref:Uncharacterized protein n=1 Tax=Eruca vesicaria subsp. sativa TaxID=29727 RepID=A0ABC8L0J1_ERUVS|nr:unnamed protein product [Eruca vesicaria subsp. sativa]
MESQDSSDGVSVAIGVAAAAGLCVFSIYRVDEFLNRNTVDESEPELEPAIKAPTAQVTSEPAMEAASAQYPDLKPPTSPTPSHP